MPESYTNPADEGLPTPAVQTGEGTVVLLPEGCPPAREFRMESCRDAMVVDALEASLASLGRIVQVDAVVKNVCPGRKTAVAVILTEVDAQGEEHPRGMKTLLVPPQEGTACQDLLLRCIPFVVPEEPDAVGAPGSLCRERTFRARVLANYADTDFVCCETADAAL